MIKPFKWAALPTAMALAASTTVARAGTEFMAFEGRNAIHVGVGGNKKVVNGLDFWIDGDPPRRFEVLGTIADKRHETGLIGLVRMSSLEADIANVAKSHGGDAVILTEAAEDLVGVVETSHTALSGSVSGTAIGNNYSGSYSGGASTVSIRREIKNRLSKYVVIRYLYGPSQVSADAQSTGPHKPVTTSDPWGPPN